MSKKTGQSLMAYMRENMPETAAFLAECSAVFGKEMVRDCVRAGLDGLPYFHAVENRLEIGTKDTTPLRAVSGDALVIRPNQPPAMHMVRGK